MPVETSVFEEDGWVTDHFSQTPLMSTYYLAWAVCNFTYRETVTKSGVVVSIYDTHFLTVKTLIFVRDHDIKYLTFLISIPKIWQFI